MNEITDEPHVLLAARVTAVCSSGETIEGWHNGFINRAMYGLICGVSPLRQRWIVENRKAAPKNGAPAPIFSGGKRASGPEGALTCWDAILG
jgi:hypothetical protein